MSTTTSQYIFNTQLFPVRVVSTSNQSGSYFNGSLNNGVGATLSFSGGLTTIDSVTLEVGDRVLLVAQTNGNENGIYEVSEIGTPGLLTRVKDLQSIEQLKEGQYIPVGAGTANAGSMYIIVEPLPGHFGIDDLVLESTQAPGGGDVSFDDVTVSGTLTVPNEGLHILDTNASHDLIVKPGSNLTADRIFTLTTGDAARLLDISAADVTISTFAATVLDDANAGAVRTTVGAQEAANIKAATTGNIGGAGAGPIVVPVTGLTAASIVVASIATSSNAVAVAKAVAGSDNFSVTFSADPGATCTLNYVAFIAAQ